MKGTTDPYALQTLGTRLTAVPAKLSDSQAKAAVEALLTVIKGTDAWPSSMLIGP